MFRGIFFTLLFISTTSMFGQVGIKVGYVGSMFDPQNVNTFLQDFNRDAELSKQFSDIAFTSGVNMGVRYQMGRHFALNADWVGSFGLKKAEGTFDDALSKLNLSYGVNSFKVGADVFTGPIGIGASFDYQTFRMTLKEDGSAVSAISQSGFAYTIYAELNFLSNNMITASLRPYIQIPLGEYNVTDLPESLRYPEMELSDSFTNFGLMFIFVNGSY